MISNGNSFSIKTAHGKISKIEQFNAFDKTHQKDWVNIFKEGMTAYNNPEDHDSWETGSTISDFQEPIDLQVEGRLAPVIETEDRGPYEHQTAEDEHANSSPYSNLLDGGITHLSDNVVGGDVYKKGRSATEPWKKRFMTVDTLSGRILFFVEKRSSLESFDTSMLRGQLEFKGMCVWLNVLFSIFDE